VISPALFPNRDPKHYRSSRIRRIPSFRTLVAFLSFTKPVPNMDLSAPPLISIAKRLFCLRRDFFRDGDVRIGRECNRHAPSGSIAQHKVGGGIFLHGGKHKSADDPEDFTVGNLADARITTARSWGPSVNKVRSSSSSRVIRSNPMAFAISEARETIRGKDPGFPTQFAAADHLVPPWFRNEQACIC